MSIITDALNRLQAERARLQGRKTQQGPPPPQPGTPPPSGSFHRKKVGWWKKGKWAVITVVGLVCLGLGAYWWGLMLVPDASQVASPPPREEPPPSTHPELMVAGTPSSSLDPLSSPSDETHSLPEVTAPPSSEPLEEPVPQLEGGPPSLSSGSIVSPLPKEEAKLSPSNLVKSTPKLSKPLAKKRSSRGRVKQRPSSSDRVPRSFEEAGVKKSTRSEEEKEAPQVSTNKVSIPNRPPVYKPPISERTWKNLPLERQLAIAQLLIKKRRYSQAATLLETLFISPPEKWEPWFWMGTAKLGLGHIDQADHYFMEGLARNGTIPHLWVQRALVGQQRGRYGQAIEFLRQAEILAPKLPEIPLNLAFSLETQGNAKLAVEYYRKFLAMTEGQPTYRSARRKVLERVARL